MVLEKTRVLLLRVRLELEPEHEIMVARRLQIYNYISNFSEEKATDLFNVYVYSRKVYYVLLYLC